MISHQSFLLIASLVLPILAYRGQLDFGLPHPGYRHSRPHLHDLGRLPLSDLGRHPDLGRLPHPDLLRPGHAEFSPRSVDSLLYQLERRDQIRYWQFLDLRFGVPICLNQDTNLQYFFLKRNLCLERLFTWV